MIYAVGSALYKSYVFRLFRAGPSPVARKAAVNSMMMRASRVVYSQPMWDWSTVAVAYQRLQLRGQYNGAQAVLLEHMDEVDPDDKPAACLFTN